MSTNLPCQHATPMSEDEAVILETIEQLKLGVEEMISAPLAPSYKTTMFLPTWNRHSRNVDQLDVADSDGAESSDSLNRLVIAESVDSAPDDSPVDEKAEANAIPHNDPSSNISNIISDVPKLAKNSNYPEEINEDNDVPSSIPESSTKEPVAETPQTQTCKRNDQNPIVETSETQNELPKLSLNSQNVVASTDAHPMPLIFPKPRMSIPTVTCVSDRPTPILLKPNFSPNKKGPPSQVCTTSQVPIKLKPMPKKPKDPTSSTSAVTKKNPKSKVDQPAKASPKKNQHKSVMMPSFGQISNPPGGIPISMVMQNQLFSQPTSLMAPKTTSSTKGPAKPRKKSPAKSMKSNDNANDGKRAHQGKTLSGNDNPVSSNMVPSTTPNMVFQNQFAMDPSGKLVHGNLFIMQLPSSQASGQQQFIPPRLLLPMQHQQQGNTHFHPTSSTQNTKNAMTHIVNANFNQPHNANAQSEQKSGYTANSSNIASVMVQQAQIMGNNGNSVLYHPVSLPTKNGFLMPTLHTAHSNLCVPTSHSNIVSSVLSNASLFPQGQRFIQPKQTIAAGQASHINTSGQMRIVSTSSERSAPQNKTNTSSQMAGQPPKLQSQQQAHYSTNNSFIGRQQNIGMTNPRTPNSQNSQSQINQQYLNIAQSPAFMQNMASVSMVSGTMSPLVQITPTAISGASLTTTLNEKTPQTQKLITADFSGQQLEDCSHSVSISNMTSNMNTATSAMSSSPASRLNTSGIFPQQQPQISSLCTTSNLGGTTSSLINNGKGIESNNSTKTFGLLIPTTGKISQVQSKNEMVAETSQLQANMSSKKNGPRARQRKESNNNGATNPNNGSQKTKQGHNKTTAQDSKQSEDNSSSKAPTQRRLDEEEEENNPPPPILQRDEQLSLTTIEEAFRKEAATMREFHDANGNKRSTIKHIVDGTLIEESIVPFPCEHKELLDGLAGFQSMEDDAEEVREDDKMESELPSISDSDDNTYAYDKRKKMHKRKSADRKSSQSPKAKKRTMSSSSSRAATPVNVKKQLDGKTKRRRRELENLLTMDFGPGKTPFQTTSVDEYTEDVLEEAHHHRIVAYNEERTTRKSSVEATLPSVQSSSKNQRSKDRPGQGKRFTSPSAEPSVSPAVPINRTESANAITTTYSSGAVVIHKKNPQITHQQRVTSDSPLPTAANTDGESTTTDAASQQQQIEQELQHEDQQLLWGDEKCNHCKRMFRELGKRNQENPQYCSKTCRKEYRKQQQAYVGTSNIKSTTDARSSANSQPSTSGRKPHDHLLTSRNTSTGTVSQPQIIGNATSAFSATRPAQHIRSPDADPHLVQRVIMERQSTAEFRDESSPEVIGFTSADGSTHWPKMLTGQHQSLMVPSTSATIFHHQAAPNAHQFYFAPHPSLVTPDSVQFLRDSPSSSVLAGAQMFPGVMSANNMSLTTSPAPSSSAPPLTPTASAERNAEFEMLITKGVQKWAPVDVARWVNIVTNSETNGDRFLAEQIDGEALQILTLANLQGPELNLKFGPALKLNNSINALRANAVTTHGDWPILEFPTHKAGILSRFSTDAGESVANVIVKEIVDNIDRPSTSKRPIALENAQELEWVMQAINHAFGLPFNSISAYNTLSSATRIYLAWMTALTDDPHAFCPEPLRKHPDQYFRRIIEAFRPMFMPQSPITDIDSLRRQSTEIRTILAAVRHVTGSVKDDFQDDVWSRILLFLMEACDQMLTKVVSQDEIGCAMSTDLCSTLFDCWIVAAVHEAVPSPSYWKTLACLAWKCAAHVPMVESWARKLLPLTVLVVQYLYGLQHSKISIGDEKINDCLQRLCDEAILKDVWLNMCQLIGNPAHVLKYCDPNVSVDFHECEELFAQWQDACSAVRELKQQVQGSNRSSNLSVSVPQNNDLQASTTQSSASSASTQISLSQPPTPLPQLDAHNPLQNRKSVLNFGIGQSTKVSGSQSRLAKNKLKCPHKPERQPRSGAMLEMFLQWLAEPAVMQVSPRHTNKYSEDVVSQKSLGSVDAADIYAHHNQPAMTTQNFARTSSAATNSDLNAGVDRRSFGGSSVTASSGDISSPAAHATNSSSVFDYPSVDGVAAGKAAALGQLCRIVCAKSSREELPEEQLAQFYLILHEALIERDRLMLCSLIYYSADLFKLGLGGIEILLPNYLMALDIILTESMKLRLHPSIHEVEMRNACLRALASIITWPSTFGHRKILECITSDKFIKGGSNNVLESDLCFVDLRSRMLRLLVHVLRNEVDFSNIHLTLSLCFVFCAENARYDVSRIRSESELNVDRQINSSVDLDESEKHFTISALRGVVSAICDNLSKVHWSSHLPTCLAALDCINSLATLPHSVLFHQQELSTGSLIVSSLCRFIDSQLQKPPMYHSKDLHSSVVAAYYSLGTWLCAAPTLTEIEPCLSTIAQTIEFGMTGGKGLAPGNYKPASQRVHDAAEYLSGTLFSDLRNTSGSIFNENHIVNRFGEENVDTKNFSYFLVGDNTIISLHEAQHIHQISSGLPTVLAVCRTPFQSPHSTYFQLKPKAKYGNTVLNDTIGSARNHGDLAKSPGSYSASSALSEKSVSATGSDENKSVTAISSADKLHASDSLAAPEPIKQFEFPPGIDKPLCKLDAEFQPLDAKDAPAEVSFIQRKLSEIRLRLNKGLSPVGDRDSRNVWIQSSLGTILSQPPRPEDPTNKCDSVRVFLYDLGLINKYAIGKEVVPLDSSNMDAFCLNLYNSVDRLPVKLLETVSIFYVRDGQRSTVDILRNNENLQSTSADFCNMLCGLGKAEDVYSFAHWTGHWDTAFLGDKGEQQTNRSKNKNPDVYTLDGSQASLWWSNNQLEVSYVLPTESTLRKSLTNMAAKIESAISSNKGFCDIPTNSLVFNSTTSTLTSAASFACDSLDLENLFQINSNDYPTISNNNSKSDLLEMDVDPTRYREKDSMLVFRTTPKPWSLDLSSKSREVWLNESFEKISALEKEYQKLTKSKTIDSISVDIASEAVDVPNELLKPPDISNESDAANPLRRLSHGPNISTFNLFNSLSPISCLVEDSSKTPPMERPKSQTSVESVPSPSANSQPQSPAISMNDPPSYTTTILTATTTSSPTGSSMSLMTATAVVVKSARFSPHRRQIFIPVMSSIPSDTASSNTQSVTNGDQRLNMSQSTCTSPSAPNSFDNDPNLAPVTPPVITLPHRRRSSMTTTVVAFAPLSETAVEFPRCPSSSSSVLLSSEPPLLGEGNAIDEEDINAALLSVKSHNFNPNCGKETQRRKDSSAAGAASRRKSLVRAALAFATSGSRKNSSDSMVVSAMPKDDTFNSKPWISRRKMSEVFSAPVLSAIVTPPTPQQAAKRSIGETERNCSITSNTSTESMVIFPVTSTNNIKDATKQKELNGPGEDGNTAVQTVTQTSAISSISYIKSFFRRKVPQDARNKDDKGSSNGDEKAPQENSPLEPTISSSDSGIETKLSNSRSSDLSQHNSTDFPYKTSDSDMPKSSRTVSNTNSEKRNSLAMGGGPDKTSQVKRALDQRIFIVWLERYEDMYHFPYDQMFPFTEDGSPTVSPNPDYVIIYLHSFEPGLVRVHTDGIWTKNGHPGPLVDGLVSSVSTLAALIQQTVCSIARRKVIEIDNYQMIHTKRRHAIMEFGKKFADKSTYCSFLERLLH
ncbi:ral GTPase-activating protein subunit beta [Ditylenchus destructor]|nr:ral GTPase-activating protein subunit beta [Ditylenchus destructor]